jgi:hypothetical protein
VDDERTGAAVGGFTVVVCSDRIAWHVQSPHGARQPPARHTRAPPPPVRSLLRVSSLSVARDAACPTAAGGARTDHPHLSAAPLCALAAAWLIGIAQSDVTAGWWEGSYLRSGPCNGRDGVHRAKDGLGAVITTRPSRRPAAATRIPAQGSAARGCEAWRCDCAVQPCNPPRATGRHSPPVAALRMTSVQQLCDRQAGPAWPLAPAGAREGVCERVLRDTLGHATACTSSLARQGHANVGGGAPCVLTVERAAWLRYGIAIVYRLALRCMTAAGGAASMANGGSEVRSCFAEG